MSKKQEKCTVYIAPGSTRCRVYAIPYPMRPGQSPADIDPKFHGDWVEVAMLDSELKVVASEPGIRSLLPDIEGQMGGSYFEVDRSAIDDVFPQPAPGEGSSPHEPGMAG